jgi:dipeptidyl aminopeptidase/acylaminoacyl peptidase
MRFFKNRYFQPTKKMSNMRIIYLLLLLSLYENLGAQAPAKKQLSIQDLVSWNEIQNPRISNDGNWVAYTLKAEEGDGTLHLWHATTSKTSTFQRGEDATFTADSRFLVFKIKPLEDSLKAQRRRKVKNDELPKDSLGILALADLALVKVPNVKSFAVPEKWSGWVAIHNEVEKKEEEKPAADSTQVETPDSTKVAAGAESPKTEKEKKKKPKKEGKDNGTKLIIRELATGFEEVVPFVKDYRLPKEGARLLLSSTGNDSTLLEGVYLFDCASRSLRNMFRQKGEFKQLSFDEKGTQLAFLANLDTTKAQIPPFGLCYWKDGLDSARILADTAAAFLPENWIVSEHARPVFSKDGSKLFFGMAPPPVLQDTNLLEEEIVNVEVWNYKDGRLYTNQETLVDNEKKRSYDVVWHIADNSFVPLASPDLPELSFGDERNASVALGYSEEPYLQLLSWEGTARRDLWLLDVKTGVRKEIAKGIRGTPRLSPQANYAFWYSELDSAWFAYSVKTGTLAQITRNDRHPFYDELNDVPDYPNPYGIAGWTKGDRHVLIYDRFDIWQIDPEGKSAPVNLTNGRAEQLTHRYIQLDPEERFVEPGQRLMLYFFDEKKKHSGYGFLLLGAGQPIRLMLEGYHYDLSPIKAKAAERLIFTRENFQIFPDLHYSDFSFQSQRQVSWANPQQVNYAWGSMELYEWTALDGQRLQGLLVKPAAFDPRKQYPMIVNFYERSSEGLYRHHRPYPGRSTINYAFYASRGYLIFNPDIPYRTGYPGESCYNAVVSGVTSLIDKGFVDKKRIGAQGHSWGGYQVAYLLTKTDLFRCAESGAPVVNMFSAYGGIRWQTGLSRMFQYEHTQSRIGGTIWEYPLRYIENSPLFSLDKTNTPVLIMHNDNDGHVPWYQGIEYFVALRRLGKPAWMLNYNDEPHWPLKLQNRKDFQLRMSQFFDYYLKDAPLPKWMERGVPAVEKGILQGLESDGGEGELGN